MRTDLRNSFNEGMNNLLTWRNRYSKQEYPEKVVLNIFYRKYTMEFMFNEIVGCFDNNFFGKPTAKWTDFNIGFSKLKTTYSTTAASKTHPVLINLLSQTQRDVGNTNYGIFAPLISEAKSGKSTKLEEIEYAYLYYLLADECILLWGAIGGTGLTKIETIGKMSGVIIEVDDIKTYGLIEQILGKFCAAAYLKEHYKPLPPNF
jgi:hypothetical protein